MAQAGYTPIQLYFSSTALAVPSSGNLIAGELALNTNDGKLYFKDSTGLVKVLANSSTAGGSLPGGTTGAIAYQSAPGTTTFLTLGSLGYLVTAGASAPVYTNPASLTVGSANTATHVAGGVANQIVYQAGAGDTEFAVAPTGADIGKVLAWSGSAFYWASAPASTTAANLSGGSAGVVPYQSATGTTAFSSVGTLGYLLTSGNTGAPTWTDPLSLAAGSIAGGIAAQIPYQTAPGVTSFIPNGLAGQILKSNGTAAPSWIDTSTLSTSNGKLYFYGQF